MPGLLSLLEKCSDSMCRSSFVGTGGNWCSFSWLEHWDEMLELPGVVT